MGDRRFLRLDFIIQLLSHNGYSVFSLIDDILTRGGNEWEHGRIKTLKEGIERDAVDICARLLNHNPASASISQWAVGVAQLSATLRSEVGTSRPESLFGSTQRTCSIRSVVCDEYLLVSTVINYGQKATVNIQVLPDDVLLEIFSFYLRDADPDIYDYLRHIGEWKTWQKLAHICQRWRRIIFASPRRLKLHLTCSYGTPVRKDLTFWPVVLPLILDYSIHRSHRRIRGDEDNIIFALEHARRVYRIDILTTSALLGQVFTAMQRPFPALTDLKLRWTTSDFSMDFDESTPFPFIPGRLLGGSTSSLRHLRFENICFPQFPTFLWSAHNLLTLKLKNIHPIGYISPEALVRGLAVLIRLRYLSFTFPDVMTPYNQWRSYPDPPMRDIFPALIHFHYRGCGNYLEDLLAHVDTPQLKHFSVKYVTRQMQVPQLYQLIDRTEYLQINQFRRATITFSYDYIRFELDWSQGESREPKLCLKFEGFEDLYVQVPRLVHLLSQFVAMFFKVDHLIVDGYLISSREMDLTEWLPFFRLFPAVETLTFCRGVAAYIASALEDTADPENSEMVADIFPALDVLRLETMDYDDNDNRQDRDMPVGSIERFLSLRQLSGHPITVVHTRDRDGSIRADQDLGAQ